MSGRATRSANCIQRRGHKLMLLAAMVLASAVQSACAESITGVVVGVADGDTLTVLDDHQLQHKVRLAGIDAPEKGQDFGQRSKQNLSAMTYRMQVVVEGKKLDRYGRFVGKVLVHGVDVNLKQVEDGMAWHYKAYEREQTPEDRLAYDTAEDAAKSLRKGLWSMNGAQPPWVFRRSRHKEHDGQLAQ
jgi:endonuclease YncB( thermonuclease family)